jgi:hypothetical protein
VHDLAIASWLWLLRLIDPGNPALHLGTALEQVCKLLPAVLAALAQLLGGIELQRRWRIIRCVLRLIEFTPRLFAVVLVRKCPGIAMLSNIKMPDFSFCFFSQP